MRMGVQIFPILTTLGQRLESFCFRTTFARGIAVDYKARLITRRFFAGGGGIMAFCLMLDYGTGSSWIDEIGDFEYPAMLEDGGGSMFRLRSGLDEYSRQTLLRSLQSLVLAEVESPGGQHEIIRLACERGEYQSGSIELAMAPVMYPIEIHGAAVSCGNN